MIFFSYCIIVYFNNILLYSDVHRYSYKICIRFYVHIHTEDIQIGSTTIVIMLSL